MNDMGTPIRVTASGVVGLPTGRLRGFYVSSCKRGSIEIREGRESSGKVLLGRTKPALGWHPLPIGTGYQVWLEIEGELDVTMVVS